MKKLMMIAAMMLISIGMCAQNKVGQITLKPMAGVNFSTMTKFGDMKMRVWLIQEFLSDCWFALYHGRSKGLWLFL